MTALIEIDSITVKFPTRFGEFTALNKVSLDVQPGEIHGLVGESGAGKSTVGAAIMGLLQAPGYIASGGILFGDVNLCELNTKEHHRLRGDRISMIFQDPQTSLNPLLTVSDQLIETIRQHSKDSYVEARRRAVALLKETGIHDVESRMDEYPHQFSGGMRQRVVIALALCTEPELIVADEPTTALDVAVQKQILDLIRKLCSQRNIGIILITHDIGVINEITDRVTVLRSGRVIESGQTSKVLGRPEDEYTKALMSAVPRLDKRLDRFTNIVEDDILSAQNHGWKIAGATAEYASQWLLGEQSSLKVLPANESILSVSNLGVVYSNGQPNWFGRKEGFSALSGIDLNMKHGEVLGVVGESGSGKSTLAKVIVGLVDPSKGSIFFKGKALPEGSKRSRRHPARREIQMVFQDPYSSLNNRQTVENIIAEPLRFYGLVGESGAVRKMVASVLELVEMPQSAMLKYPHQFSGGQRQRVAIARALLARPEFLICDEPTSALDVSIQAQILNLLKDLQTEFGLSILFISHNLAVIRQMADRVIVLRHGQLVEAAETECFFESPQEPYSKQLLSETPSLSRL